jgi:hypothetical protein
VFFVVISILPQSSLSTFHKEHKERKYETKALSRKGFKGTQRNLANFAKNFVFFVVKKLTTKFTKHISQRTQRKKI